jgi:hypothetical protein
MSALTIPSGCNLIVLVLVADVDTFEGIGQRLHVHRETGVGRGLSIEDRVRGLSLVADIDALEDIGRRLHVHRYNDIGRSISRDWSTNGCDHG